MTAKVTIGIPAWEAADFLVRTLDSARAQTFEDIQILVSIDPSDDGTEEVCRTVAREDDRIRVVVHEERLGWVGNMNAILDLVETDYFVLLSNDDLLEAEYVERLLPEVERDEETVLAYGDILLVGSGDRRFTQDPPTGTAMERMARFLANSPSGNAMRGVTRRRVIDAGVRLRDNPFAGFYAGTTYVLEMLALGPMTRVAEPLYRKWVRPDSVHESVWKSWSPEKKVAAWVEHTVSCLEVVAASRLDAAEKHHLAVMSMDRLERLTGPNEHLSGLPWGRDLTVTVMHGLVAGRIAGLPIPEEPVIEAITSDPHVTESLAQRLYGQAILQRDSGAPHAAVELLARALRFGPDMAEAHLQRAAILFDLGRYEEGVADARRAVASSPRDARALLVLSHNLGAVGRHDEAVSAVLQALQIDSTLAGAEDHLAWLQTMLDAADEPIDV